MCTGKKALLFGYNIEQTRKYFCIFNSSSRASQGRKFQVEKIHVSQRKNVRSATCAAQTEFICVHQLSAVRWSATVKVGGQLATVRVGGRLFHISRSSSMADLLLKEPFLATQKPENPTKRLSSTWTTSRKITVCEASNPNLICILGKSFRQWRKLPHWCGHRWLRFLCGWDFVTHRVTHVVIFDFQPRRFWGWFGRVPFTNFLSIDPRKNKRFFFAIPQHFLGSPNLTKNPCFASSFFAHLEGNEPCYLLAYEATQSKTKSFFGDNFWQTKSPPFWFCRLIEFRGPRI